MSLTKAPLTAPIRGLRQKKRARHGAGWLVYWEPSAPGRKAGLTNVSLDADRPAWSEKKARALNAEQEKILRQTSRPARRFTAIDDLIEKYKRDRAYLDRSPATQRDYSQTLGVISGFVGAENQAHFAVPAAQALVNRVLQDSGAHSALKTKRVGSILFAWAITNGYRTWTEGNPFQHVRASVPPPGQRQASWDGAQALFAAANELASEGALHAADIGVALQLMLFHGDRVGDVRTSRQSEFRLYEMTSDRTLVTARADQRLERWEVANLAELRDSAAVTAATQFGQLTTQGGRFVTWYYTRSKRGNARAAILRPEVRDAVWKLLVSRPKARTHLFGTSDLPLSVWQWRDAYNRVRARAADGMPELASITMRDLRRTHASMARRGGASLSETARSLGNTADKSRALEEVYMPEDFVTGSEAAMQIRAPAALQLRVHRMQGAQAQEDTE